MTLLEILEAHLKEGDDLREVLSKVEVDISIEREYVHGYGSATDECITAKVAISYQGEPIHEMDDSVHLHDVSVF